MYIFSVFFQVITPWDFTLSLCVRQVEPSVRMIGWLAGSVRLIQLSNKNNLHFHCTRGSVILMYEKFWEMTKKYWVSQNTRRPHLRFIFFVLALNELNRVSRRKLTQIITWFKKHICGSENVRNICNLIDLVHIQLYRLLVVLDEVERIEISWRQLTINYRCWPINIQTFKW